MKRLRQLVSSVLSHNLTRSSAIVLTGTMVGNVSAYLYHLFIGRILGPVHYGELTALMSLLYIINVPTIVLSTVLIKFFSVFKARETPGKSKYLFVLTTKRFIAGGIVGLVLLLPFIGLTTSFLHISSPLYIVWLYIVFATSIFAIINVSVLTGYQKFVEASIYPNIGGVLRLVFGVIGSFFGVGWTLVSNIFSNIVSYGTYFLSLRFLTKVKSIRFSLSEINVSGYSIPAFLAILGITALFSQDVILVKHFFNPLEAGVYAALSVLGRIIYFASFAVGTVMFPVIAERKEQTRGHGKVVLFGLLGVLVLSAGLTVLYFLFPSLVVHALYGAAYDGAVPYLGLFGLFITFFSLSYLLTNVCLASSRTRVWVLTITAALIQTGLISLFHTTLTDVVTINTIVAAGLLGALLLYYRHAEQIP